MEKDINVTMNRTALRVYQEEVLGELSNILDWWMQHMPDTAGEGFWGSIDVNGAINRTAPRGLVLNSRILWTFSAAVNQQPERSYLQMAERAFDYLLKYFTDHEHGGMYWSVDRQGNALEDKKQVYGLAFAIYGMSEFYKASGNDKALRTAIDLYELIEQHNATIEQGGYIEAFSREWQPLEDLRLSEKDANEQKSMNTHLHVLEAYTNLYRIWKHKGLANAIRQLLSIFEKYIIDKTTYTQHLFFAADWSVRSSVISYGHDIEASWLLYEATQVLEDKALELHWKTIAIRMATAATAGLDKDGGTWYEKDGTDLIREKHWWPQAEAMVGFLNAYELSLDNDFLDLSVSCFSFIKTNLLDHRHGEWFWGIYKDGSIIEKEKAGFWKCPYHNSRACMEVSRRLQNIIHPVAKHM